jgi:hypothetical protein
MKITNGKDYCKLDRIGQFYLVEIAYEDKK